MGGFAVAMEPWKRCLPCVEPHTVDLVALPDPYVAITFDGVVAGRQARYLCEKGTRHIGQWTEEEIVHGVESKLFFYVNACFCLFIVLFWLPNIHSKHLLRGTPAPTGRW